MCLASKEHFRLIEAKNIHKSYGDLEVLKGISLSIDQSEVVSIVGASGAGKSTLLQILGTLDTADQGEIWFEGKDIAKMSRSQMAYLRNREMGFVFQFHHLLPEFTALENVCIPGYIGGASRKNAGTRAGELLDFLGLKDRMGHKPSELSGGEQQRVAVARALMNDPKVVFADEPSGNLDSDNAEELHEMFFSLRDEFGQTFVIVTHNQSLAARADRTIRMKDGLLIDSESSGEIISQV